jgi:hypothetical protein
LLEETEHFSWCQDKATNISSVPLLKKDPLYRKELLWFFRDRGAIVQTILIPITIAGFQLFNLRPFLQRAAFRGVR